MLACACACSFTCVNMEFMCLRAHVHLQICTFVFVSACVIACAYVQAFVCVHFRMRAFVCVHVCVRTCLRFFAFHVSVFAYMCMHVCVHVSLCSCALCCVFMRVWCTCYATLIVAAAEIAAAAATEISAAAATEIAAASDCRCCYRDCSAVALHRLCK